MNCWRQLINCRLREIVREMAEWVSCAAPTPLFLHPPLLPVLQLRQTKVRFVEAAAPSAWPRHPRLWQRHGWPGAMGDGGCCSGWGVLWAFEEGACSGRCCCPSVAAPMDMKGRRRQRRRWEAGGSSCSDGGIQRTQRRRGETVRQRRRLGEN